MELASHNALPSFSTHKGYVWQTIYVANSLELRATIPFVPQVACGVRKYSKASVSSSAPLAHLFKEPSAFTSVSLWFSITSRCSAYLHQTLVSFIRSLTTKRVANRIVHYSLRMGCAWVSAQLKTQFKEVNAFKAAPRSFSTGSARSPAVDFTTHPTTCACPQYRPGCSLYRLDR